MCTAVLNGWAHLGSYTKAILVSQDIRHHVVISTLIMARNLCFRPFEIYLDHLCSSFEKNKAFTALHIYSTYLIGQNWARTGLLWKGLKKTRTMLRNSKDEDLSFTEENWTWKQAAQLRIRCTTKYFMAINRIKRVHFYNCNPFIMLIIFVIIMY